VALPGLFKLEKLTIEAFEDAERSTKAERPNRMTVMFNPTSFQEKHANTYQPQRVQALNSSDKASNYLYSPPGELSFTLVLDGTGVSDYGAVSLGGDSVRTMIDTLKKLCFNMNGDSHEPNFLKLSWGPFKWGCRLSTLDITYKLFDRSGEPLRAELAVAFLKDKDAKTILLEENKKSADLTHVRTVKSGDTLPLLCKEIYGSAGYYLRVAADNGLDDFRNLTPGQKLRFRPLDALSGS